MISRVATKRIELSQNSGEWLCTGEEGVKTGEGAHSGGVGGPGCWSVLISDLLVGNLRV